MSRSIYQYIKRGIRYILHGQPSVTIEMHPNIALLAPNLLLHGKTALVTGSSRGIGYAIAEGFLRAGADVIITSRNSHTNENAVKQLRKQYPERKVSGYVMDISDIPVMKRIMDEIVRTNDRIDILVNNAGVNGHTTLGNHSEDEWDCIINANLKGTYFISEYMAKYMKKEGIAGNILNIASSSSLRPATNAYMTSKWGIRGLTLGFAKACIPHNIVVNGIAPGPTSTDMQDNGGSLYIESSPISRLILPEEIANMAIMMVSDVGRSIVGDIVYMTGGAGIITFDDLQYKI